MIVEKRKFGLALISCLIAIIDFMLVMSFANGSYEEIVNYYFILLITNIVFEIIVLKLSEISLLSPAVLFLLFIYIFHFGQVILEGRYEYDYINYLNHYMSGNMEALRYTLQICFFATNATFLGIIFGNLFYKKSSGEMLSVIDENSERSKCKTVGLGLFIISSPFRFLLDGAQLLAAMATGYTGAISAISIPGIFVTISSFWYSSIIFLFLGYKNKRIMYLGLAYTVFTMLTGNRGHQLTNIIAMMLVYFVACDIKLKTKTVVKYGLIGYVMLVFIDMIMNFRSVGISDFFANFNEYLTISTGGNIIFETIGSFGETIFTPYLVVVQMGSHLKPIFCESWLYSILTIIPNIGGITTVANHNSVYQKMINTNHTIGGSYVGDLFYNFKGGYWIAAIAVGFFMIILSNKFYSAIKERRYSKLFYYVPVFYNAFWWVRDAMGNELRPVVWQILFSIFFISLAESRKRI